VIVDGTFLDMNLYGDCIAMESMESGCCTLYLKMYAKDDIIEFGKWVVPVFVSDASGSLGR
jgi:hypothetical protein